MHENDIAREVVDASMKVHTALGPGLLESVYEAAMAYELERRGFSVQRQLPVDVSYDGHSLGLGFKADLLINEKLLVELKAVETMKPLFQRQTLSYLRCGNWRLGLLLNFNVPRLRDGIQRIVNGLDS